jgi:hypothetical protein
LLSPTARVVPPGPNATEYTTRLPTILSDKDLQLPGD